VVPRLERLLENAPVDARIIGTAETEYRRHPHADSTTTSLLVGAARAALADASIEPKDVDGLGVSSFSLAPDGAIDLAFRLGLSVRWLMDARTGGASAIDMLQHARRAVEAGDARTIVLLAGDRLDPPDFVRLVDEYNSATRDHLAPIPTGGPNALFAMLTARHMAAHGLDRSVYGQVALAQRAWAADNPNAAYRTPLTLDEYLDAPLVADPLSIYDCVPLVAGADAIVVAAEGAKGVRIRALLASYNHDHQDGDGYPTGLGTLREALWEQAGTSPDDVDVVSVYDDYPVMTLVQLDDLGFARDGDLRRLVAERIATRALALNTSGGQLSAGQAGAAGGMHGLVEVVRQLRGEAGERQVAGARLGLVTGYGMVVYRHGACANAVVLEAGA
jgi:acetyl-CoA acetyltransferase